MNRGSKPPPLRLALWSVAVLLSVAVAPTGSRAAGAATPTPTPTGPSYFITWTATASDSATFQTAAMSDCLHKPGLGKLYCGSYREQRTSTSVQGSAVFRLIPNGQQFAIKKTETGAAPDIRVISAADSHDYDWKEHETWNCGDLVQTHHHLSIVETNLAPKYPFPIMHPPAKRPDGSWIIKGAVPEWMDTCLETDNDRACWGMNRTDRRTVPCDAFGYMIGAAPPGTFDLEAQGSGDYFRKQVTYQGVDQEPLLGNAKSKLNVTWDIEVRRIGKCLVGDSIPIKETDDQSNPDINDEDIEMGVEYGKSSIDPDTGIAPLNIRVTCDQVPIKNARVQVKVEVQKNTGGHLHDAAGRPRGSLKWNGVEKKLTDQKPSIEVKTDDDGRAHLTFKPGKAKNHDDLGIAGIYRITAASVRFPMSKTDVAVEAKVDGLSRLDADSNYVDDVGGAAHTSGDNATDPTKQALHKFAAAFEKAQTDHNQELAACGAPQWPIYPLWVIDVSLPYGGLYDDLKNNWSTPHQTHGHGDGVDFSANSAGFHQTTSRHTVVISSGRCATCPGSWPDVGATIPVCDGYTIAPEGWLMMTMMRLGTKYGHWDKADLCSDYKNNPHPKCPGDALWHLHVNQ